MIFKSSKVTVIGDFSGTTAACRVLRVIFTGGSSEATIAILVSTQLVQGIYRDYI